MPTSSALRSGVKNYARYLNVLAGTEPYVAPALSAYDLLQTEILTGSQSSVTFSSLEEYASNYQHLQLRAVVQTDRAAASDDVNVTVNSITSSYAFHALFRNAGSVTSGEDSPNKVAMRIVGGASGNSISNLYGAFVCNVLDFSSSDKNTTIKSLGGVPRQTVALSSGLTNNTAAVTSITLAPYLGSNFVAGTRWSLYGLRKAS